MTLKEKFQKEPVVVYQESFILTNQSTEQLIEIADEFAIEFAEWTSYKYKYLEHKGWFRVSYELEMGIFKSSQELLKIFKKEKGL